PEAACRPAPAAMAVRRPPWRDGEAVRPPTRASRRQENYGAGQIRWPSRFLRVKSNGQVVCRIRRRRCFHPIETFGDSKASDCEHLLQCAAELSLGVITEPAIELVQNASLRVVADCDNEGKPVARAIRPVEIVYAGHLVRCQPVERGARLLDHRR